MYIASSLLHGVKPRPRLQFQLNRLDHMSIFLVIAGTYTPIVIMFFSTQLALARFAHDVGGCVFGDGVQTLEPPNSRLF